METLEAEVRVVRIDGQPWQDWPEDLYIPPDALEVALERFEGPLDLLLYLIRKQNLDILDIPVAHITHQYMRYVDAMQGLRFELAADYLVMAAVLGEIKSRCLLPRPSRDTQEEEDPRAELVRRLQEYERFKKAAEVLDQLPLEGRELLVPMLALPEVSERSKIWPEVGLNDLLQALAILLKRAELFESHQVSREGLTLRERMSEILEQIHHADFLPFIRLFRLEEGKIGIVVSFMAVLELVKEGILELVQADFQAPIFVRNRIMAGDEADAIG